VLASSAVALWGFQTKLPRELWRVSGVDTEHYAVARPSARRQLSVFTHMVNAGMQSIMKPGSLESNSTAAVPASLPVRGLFRDGRSRRFSDDVPAASPTNGTPLPDSDALNNHDDNNTANQPNSSQEMTAEDEVPICDNVTEKLAPAAAKESSSAAASPPDEGAIVTKKNDNLQEDITEKIVPTDPSPQKQEAKKGDDSSSPLPPEDGLTRDNDEKANATLSLERATKKINPPIIDDTEESSDTNKNDSSEELPCDKSQTHPRIVVNKNDIDAANGNTAKVSEQLPQKTIESKKDGDSATNSVTEVFQVSQPVRDEIPTSKTETLRNGTEKTASLPPANPLAEEANGKGNDSSQTPRVGSEQPVVQFPGDTDAARKAVYPQNSGEKTEGATPQPLPVENGTNKNRSTTKGTELEKENSVSSPTMTDRVHRIVNPLRSLVELEDAGTRASRKRKLFCLFMSYDSSRMDELASVAKVQRISQLLTPPKKPAVGTARPNLPSNLPVAVGLFPHPALAHAAVRPPDKSLKDLEKETLSFHLPPRVEIQPDREAPSMRAFSIRFLECSVSAIARWSTIRASASRLLPEDICRRACVDTNFRKCGVCGNWGHYEKHCAHVQPLEAYRISPSSRRLATKPQRRRPPLPSAAENEVTVEDCDGFLIEQRAVPRPDFSKDVDKTQKRDDVVETTVGGIRISASTSYSGPAAPIKEGDVVAWKMNEQRMLAGAVESVDMGRGLVTARCIRSISLDATNLEGDTGEDDLDVLFSLPSKRVRCAKRPGVPSQSSRRTKRSKYMNEDGTLRSRTTPRLLNDGTFQQPRGRKPGGKEWDHVRGLWAPVSESLPGL